MTNIDLCDALKEIEAEHEWAHEVITAEITRLTGERDGWAARMMEFATTIQERDALAAVIDAAPHGNPCLFWEVPAATDADCDCYKSKINPTATLATRDAEKKAETAEAIFLRINALPKKGNTFQVHVSDLLQIMAEHGVTE